MAWRYKENFCLFRNFRHHNAAFINRQRMQRRTALLKNIAGIRISRIFNADMNPRSHQCRRDQVKPVLCAQGNEYFLLRRIDAAPWKQLAADLQDKLRIVRRYRIIRPVPHGVAAHRLTRTFPPCRQRKEAGIGLAIDEGIGILLPVCGLDDIPLGGKPGIDQPVPRHRGALIPVSGKPGAGCRGDIADPIAGSRNGDEKIAFHQLVIDDHHGRPRYPEVIGQLPAGGHFCARGQLPVQDACDNLFAKLVLNRMWQMSVDSKQQLFRPRRRG